MLYAVVARNVTPGLVDAEIKAIKLYAWEAACMKRVTDARHAERRSILTMEVR